MAACSGVLLSPHADSIPKALPSLFSHAGGCTSCGGVRGWTMEPKAASPQAFFTDPSQWWDYTVHKTNPKSPDCLHKQWTPEVLWIEGLFNPPWVKEKLIAMTQSQEQSGDGGISECGFDSGEEGELLGSLKMTASVTTYLSVLQECIQMRNLRKGKQVHVHIIQSGFKPNNFLRTTLFKMYVKCGAVEDARQVFEEISQRNLFTWTIMISAYAKHGCGSEALELYEQMQQEGVMGDKVTWTCVLNACASLAALEKGKQVHADFLKAGIPLDIILETALVHMYAKCKSMKDARGVFDKMAERDVVSWSAMIAGYAQHGCGQEAFDLYEQMIQEGVLPDKVTFICTVNACASLGSLKKAHEIHADIIKARIVPDISLETGLVDMYAKCGSIKDARQVFNYMAQRNVVSWNAMITGYAQQGCGREAFELYDQMIQEGITPDKVTFVSVVNACASLGALEKGRKVHAAISKSRVAPDIILQNTLVDMYAKCGSVKDALQVFDNIPQRDVVSWNALITGYAQNACDREALEMYDQMKREGVTPNRVTFICAIGACTSLAALEKGKEIHADIVKAGIAQDIIVETALAYMYGKCGSIQGARDIFNSMPERNVVSWNAIIAGYTQHGFGREALQLFEQMQQEGFKPDNITFVCLLSACSRVGLEDEGHHYFDSMSQDHGLTPTAEHFGCMVDLLGRGGRLNEAKDLINIMPIEPCASVWRSLLGACKIHGDVNLAEHAAICLLELDPLNAGIYALLSNTYAAAGT